MVELLLWPLVAGLVLAGIHAYFGLHVLARGVVFVDLSLAQVAALGLTVAILAGHSVHSEAGYWYALAFAIGGAVLFALARPYEMALQQEAVIGIVYAVSASLGVLALDRAPQGAEHIKQLLIGSILTVTPQDVGQLALLYGVIGAVHFLFRRPLIEVSFNPLLAAAQRRRIFLWDVVFYGSFALVVTSSVRIAGVLLVFSYLIVPAALAGLFAAGFRSAPRPGVGARRSAHRRRPLRLMDLGFADRARDRHGVRGGHRAGRSRPVRRDSLPREMSAIFASRVGRSRRNAARGVPENGSAMARCAGGHGAARSDCVSHFG